MFEEKWSGRSGSYNDVDIVDITYVEHIQLNNSWYNVHFSQLFLLQVLQVCLRRY